MKGKKVDYVDVINTLAFIVMVVIVLLQIFARYVIHISIPWTEELARYLLILITFIGGALAIRNKQHIAVTVIINKLPKKVRFYLNKFFEIIEIVFLIVVFKGSVIMINCNWEAPVGAISWLTKGKLYLILPVSIVMMVTYLLNQLVNERLDKK